MEQGSYEFWIVATEKEGVRLLGERGYFKFWGFMGDIYPLPKFDNLLGDSNSTAPKRISIYLLGSVYL